MNNSDLCNPTCIWNKKVKDTELEKFKNYINTKHGTKFETSWDFHEWSVTNYPDFWESILTYFNVIYSGKYQEVAKKVGNALNDIDWFSGAKMNVAENLLRHRDENIALICTDEDDNEEIFTYAQLYEQAKMYASALKKLGLQPGDMVACYMPNRQEALFAMLGAVSLGGIWGGPLPFYGVQGASIILKQMKPRFLFTIDRFKYGGREFNLLQNLPDITNDLESLEKVIIVPTRPNLLPETLSTIKNSCLLKEFLDYGKNVDGSYSDIIFLQLPFMHPFSIAFTSGTTGSPKGFIHPAGGLLPLLLYNGFYANVTRKDVILTTHPVGWTVWNLHTYALALGAKLLMYNGDPVSRSKTYFWDLISKYRVSYTFLATTHVDQLERNGVIPRPDCDLKNLRLIVIGSSPVKSKNFNFLHGCIKHDDILLGIMYGCTEICTPICAYDINMPIYAEEIQLPILALDLKCYDEEGHSVVGSPGELIIAGPHPGFPVGIVNDSDKRILNESYFSKYKGVWTLHDEVCFNPITKGMIVLGRSDETMNPKGKRFNAADIYSIVQTVEEVGDYLCVSQSNSEGSDTRCILFVIVKEGYNFSKELVNKIENRIKSDLTIYHVPEKILEAKGIPYNFNNKRMEALAKRIIAKNEVPEVNNVRNPDCLKNFVNIPELQNY